LYEYINDGTSNYWIDIQTPTLSTAAGSGTSGVSGLTITVDTFIGTGACTTFALSVTPVSINFTSATVANVVQQKASYTVSGSNIVFSEAPANNSQIEVTTYGSEATIYANTVNAAFTTANSAGSYANAAFATANTVTSASSYANAAFARANTGTSATITDDTSTNATRYPLLSTGTSGSLTGANTSSSKLTYNPSTGTLTATQVTTSSDAVLKNDIVTFENALDVVKSLRGVSFTWKDNGAKNIGLVAQEVQEILPEIVTEDLGLKSINYSSIVGVLVEAIKELKVEIDSLKSRKKK
jgi:hypothetical protein